MAIEVSCPGCRKSYRVKDELAGKAIRCRECQQTIRIPASAPEEQAEESLIDPDPASASGGSGSLPRSRKKPARGKSKSRRKSGTNASPYRLLLLLLIGGAGIGLAVAASRMASKVLEPKPEFHREVAEQRQLRPRGAGVPAPVAPAPAQPAPPALPAAQPVVVLQFTGVSLQLFTSDQALRRELYRQSFLLTAREKFGFAVRDSLLREPAPPNEASAVPHNVEVRGDRRGGGRVDVRREVPGGRNAVSVVASVPLPEPIGNQIFNSLATSLALAEKEYSKALGQISPPWPTAPAGPSAAIVDEPPQPEILWLVADLRRLHRALRADPDSSRYRGMIAVRYALLSTVTEPHWSPDSKLFMARALLYAEQAAQRSPQDAQAAWSRAFVRTLLFLDQPATEEIARAKALPSDVPPPAWAEAVEALANWDEDRLAAAAREGKPLATYFRLLSREVCGTEDERMLAAQDVLRQTPTCFRATFVLSSGSNLGYRRSFGAAQLEMLTTDLSELLSRIDLLPKPVQDALPAARNAQSPADRMAMVARLCETLRAVPLDQDDSEPSLAATASLIENLAFAISLQQLKTERVHLGVDPGSSIKLLEGMLKHHPLRALLRTYSGVPGDARAAVDEVTTALLDSSPSAAAQETILS